MKTIGVWGLFSGLVFALGEVSAQGTLEIDSLAGKSGNSPYLGRRMPGAVRHVLFRGRPTVVDGALA